MQSIYYVVQYKHIPMNEKLPTPLEKNKKSIPDSKESSHATINDYVDTNINQLTLSALSSALGDMRVVKLSVTGKGSAKYTAVTDPEELIVAMQYIARFSNTHITPVSLKKNEDDFSYFALQQSAISMPAWNSLIDRRLGKIPQEAKIEASIQFDLVAAGMKAYDRGKVIEHRDVTPGMPKIYTTNA